jgi:VanZ family protein
MLNPPNRSKLTTLSKFALALFWLALFAATHVPPTLSFLPPQGSDKVAHFAAYAMLALLLATTWQLAGGVLTSRHLGLAWLAAALYGALDEVTQIPVGRDCNIWDWTADALGAATGLLLFVWLRRMIERRMRSNQ